MTMTVDNPSPSEQLTTITNTLVEQLASHVASLRHLQQRLDAGAVGEPELRQLTGPILIDTVDMLAVMRGFQQAIQHLDHSELTADTLTQPTTAHHALLGWIRDVHNADHLIHADLTSQRALLASIRQAIGPDDTVAHNTLQLIEAIALNAIDRLDRATPPDPDGTISLTVFPALLVSRSQRPGTGQRM